MPLDWQSLATQPGKASSFAATMHSNQPKNACLYHAHRSLRRVIRERGLVQADAQIARCIQKVAKSVFDLRLVSLSICEEVVAHCGGSAVIKNDSCILETDSSPALDGEARVLTDDGVGGLCVLGDKI